MAVKLRLSFLTMRKEIASIVYMHNYKTLRVKEKKMKMIRFD